MFDTDMTTAQIIFVLAIGMIVGFIHNMNDGDN